MKALVTGGTGFVGSHVVWALLDAGHQVRVLHRQTSKLTALANMDYESAIGDLHDLDGLRAACAGVDWVFHVAAVADYWRADKQRMLDVNVEGTRRVLQAARDARVKRVVFTSSAAAVGLREDGQPGDESLPFNLPPDQFPYGHSKSLAEDVVRLAVADGQDVVIVNPVVVMGPGDLNMISGSFITEVKRFGPLVPVTSGGLAVTDARDVARWHLMAAEKGRTGERYILGTTNTTHREWYAMIARTVGAMKPRLPVPDGLVPTVANAIQGLRSAGIKTPVDANQARLSIRNVYFDYDKAWTEFGEPRIDMEQSLHDTYAWYRAHGYVSTTTR